MARIAGVNIPTNKHVSVALTYIYGIGASRGISICQQAGVEPTTRVKDLQDDHVAAIRKVIEEGYKVEGDLRREIGMNMKHLIDIGCYRGVRHRKSLPVRGQKTHANARTRRGRAKPIAGKKV